MIDFNKGNKFKNIKQEELPKVDISSLLCIGDARIKNTNDVMYLNILINNTPTFIIYKKVSLYKNQYIRLLHFPITTPRNPQLECKILMALRQQYPQIQEILTTMQDFEEHNVDITRFKCKIWATDFYDPLPQQKNGKHKSKIKYTKYQDLINMRLAQEQDYLDIMNILTLWEQDKKINDTLYNKKTFNSIKNNFPLFLQDPFKVYVTTFKDTIVSYQILYSQGDILFQLVNQAYKRDIPTLEEYSKDIIAYVHKWQHYLTLLEFNDQYARINYEYASNQKGGLYNFKNNLYQCKEELIQLKFKEDI